MRHFHHPFCHFGRKPVLQTNGLLGLVSVFGRFWGYQILPNFTIFYQKCVAKGVRRQELRMADGITRIGNGNQFGTSGADWNGRSRILPRRV